MPGTLGTIRGEMILDVKKAIASYTAARQAHVATVTALHTGAGALAASGAAIAGVGAIMVAGLMSAVSAAAEFEKSMDYFAAISGATQAEYDAVSQKALQLGADSIYSAGQVADAFIELGKSGVKTQSILDGVGDAVIALGAATDIPLADAAQSLTTILNTFQISADGAVDVVNKLAGAANSSSIDVQDLITTMTYVGASAKVAGISFGDVNAAIALLGERGIKGSKAGTGLRQMFDKLIAPTNAGKEALKELGIVTEDGTNALLNMDGTLKPIPALLDALNGALGPLTTDQKVDLLGKIFPITSLPTILSLLDGGSAGMARLTEEINKTSAYDIAEKRLDNLAGSIEKFRGAVETLKISAGGNMQEFAKFWVDLATDLINWFSTLGEGWQNTILIIIASVGSLLIVIGTLGLFASAILNIYAAGIILGPVLIALGAALKTAAGGFVAMNLAIASSPLGRILGIIALVVGALVTLYTTSETFRNAVQPIFDALVGLFATLSPIITNVLGIVQQFFGQLAGGAAAAGPAAIGILGQLAGILSGALGTAIQTIVPPFLSFVMTIVNFLMPAVTALMPLLSALGAILAAVFSGNFSALPDLIGTAMQAFTGLIQVVSQQLIPAVIQVITNVITALIGALPMIVEAGVGLFMGLVQAIATVLPMIITAALNIVIALITALVSAAPMIIMALVQGLTGLITALTTLIPMIIQAGLQLILGLIQGIVTALPMVITAVVTLLPQLISAILQMLPLLITAALQLFMGLVLGLVQALPQILTALIDAGIQILLTIVGMIPQLLTTAVELFMQILLALITAIPQILTALITLGPQLTMQLIGMIPQLIMAAIQLFIAIVTGLAEALPQIITALVEAGPQMVQALIDAGPQFADAGMQLIQGLIDGFGSMGGALWDAAQNIASSAIDGIKSFFGIASPSKVFHQIGIWTIQGLVNGIGDMRNTAIDTVTSLASALSAIPMQLSAMDSISDSINVTKRMIASGSISTMNADPALASIDKTLKVLKDRPQQVHYDIPITNPIPEKGSSSIPRALRAASYVTA